jgi:hypothetical protein
MLKNKSFGCSRDAAKNISYVTTVFLSMSPVEVFIVKRGCANNKHIIFVLLYSSSHGLPPPVIKQIIAVIFLTA